MHCFMVMSGNELNMPRLYGRANFSVLTTPYKMGRLKLEHSDDFKYASYLSQPAGFESAYRYPGELREALRPGR